MSVLIVELYDALKDAGASEERARAVARAVSDNEVRLNKIEGRLDTIDGRLLGVQAQLDGLKAQVETLKMRTETLTWVMGLNAALTFAILVRTFFQ
jgi:chromosome segregation ATPase